MTADILSPTETKKKKKTPKTPKLTLNEVISQAIKERKLKIQQKIMT